MMTNRFTDLMNEGVQTLLRKNVKWPKELNSAHIIELCTKMLEFYESIEEYHKCAELNNYIKVLNQKQNSKKAFEK